MLVSLSKNQAEAIRADLTEINLLQEQVKLRQALNARFVNCIIRDAGHDPAAVDSFEIKEANGTPIMFLTPKPSPPPAPAE